MESAGRFGAGGTSRHSLIGTGDQVADFLRFNTRTLPLRQYSLCQGLLADVAILPNHAAAQDHHQVGARCSGPH